MTPTESPGKSIVNTGVVLSLALAILLASVGTSIANIALPALAIAFEARFHQVQWVVVTYLAGLTLFTMFAGRLGDIFGRGRMLLAGLLLYSLASILCGFASNIWFLIAARAVQGVGAAFLMTLTLALVRETTGTNQIGRTMGLLGTVSAVGTALGPSLGGFLIAALDWRAVFLILVPIGLLAFGLALRFLPHNKPETRSPMITLVAFRDGGFTPNLIANLLVATVMMTTLIVGPFYLGLALKLPEAMIGLIMSIGPGISILCGVPSGRLVDRCGPGPVLALGLIALIVGAFTLSVFPKVFGVIGYIAAIAVLTPGYQLFQAANNTAVMSRVRAEQHGVMSGLLNLSRNLGHIIGASAMGAVFSFGVGTRAIEDATSGSIADGMQLAYVVAGALMIAAFWISRWKMGRSEHAEL